MPKPISAPSVDKTPIRVAIVTMDSNLAGAADRAAEDLRREIPGLDLSFHSADVYAANPVALQAVKAAIATADLVIVGMLFLEDHFRPILADLTARRDHCDAIACLLSAAEVMRLTRLGKFAMSGEATGVMALLKRLRGGSKTGTSGQGQMRMLKQLPKLLRFIPGTAQDVRAYFLCLQAWLAGTPANLAGMVRLLAHRYAAGPRRALGLKLKPEAPLDYPEIGLYHPRAKTMFSEDLKRLPPLPTKAVQGRVGLLILRSYVLAGNTQHYDGVIAAFEALGLEVVPAFASGLDQRPAVEKFFMRQGMACVDAVVSLTGFSLVGGPAYNDARAAEEMLARLDVPYVVAHPLEFQTQEDWGRDQRGLSPVESTMMVAIPELDGAILPMTFGGRAGAAAIAAEGARQQGRNSDMRVIPERAATLAARVAKLVRLRRTNIAQRRVAVVVFNFPPNAGAVGTAAFLSVFESLFNVLGAMRDQGYVIDMPDSVDDLRRRLLEGNAARFGMMANVAARVPLDQYVRREPHLRDIERQWGPAPGKLLTDGASLMVLGVELGNVFVGVQPSPGYEGDPMRLLFEQGFAPTHAFSAFYRWIREDFAADAVLHFGTHGALEFMPGKQAGMSDTCWPDRLIADLPNFNIYAANNPSEGALAKRRACATLISHMTPPITQAGLYRGLADLKASLDQWRAREPGVILGDLAALIQAQAAAVDLAPVSPAWDDAERAIDALVQNISAMESTLIPVGLHVIGRPMDASKRADLLDAAGIHEPQRRQDLDRILAQDHETPAILHALSGGFTRPVVGGDFLTTPEIAPTGRNLHGFDPFRLPSAFAVKDGAAQADRLLAFHQHQHGALPETVAMVLWGTDNIKSAGGPLAQALWLIGAAPRHDSYGRVVGARLVPLADLGRPRIDVMVTISGIFRDLLPLQTKLLAEAALLAAAADEPVTMNFVRKHALDLQAREGVSLEDAALRVFGNDDGAYGANVNLMIDNGAWSNEDELAEAFARRKGYAYGTDGRPRRHDLVMRDTLASVEVAYQNLDSVELGVTSIDHYFDTLGGINRAVQRLRGKGAEVYVGDQTQGAGLVRTLADQVSLESRTRLLNPKFFESLLEHGYEGVRTLETHLTNTMGWSATTGQVEPWVYQRFTETFVLDKAMRDRLAALNVTAAARMTQRLMEAEERRYWTPDAETLAALRQIGDDMEDRLEGVNTEVAA